jgi:hypothetical protein
MNCLLLFIIVLSVSGRWPEVNTCGLNDRIVEIKNYEELVNVQDRMAVARVTRLIDEMEERNWIATQIVMLCTFAIVMALVLALTWETEDYSVYTEKVGNTY